jgi:(S)-3,5-dihydroxyphenylglycine transaminase
MTSAVTRGHAHGGDAVRIFGQPETGSYPMAAREPLNVGLLHASLSDPAMSSMNFLNEIAGRYPGAVPFAAGRPVEEFFDVADLHRYLDVFCSYLLGLGRTPEEVRRCLFQYSRTKGIINDLVARHLAVDEDIDVDPESIVVTVGCQEAMFLAVRALRFSERDVLLAISPTYVGLVGAASIADLPIVPVPGGPRGLDPDALRARIRAVVGQGLRPRGLYIMPDFANPSGVSLGTDQRRRLLEIAEQEDLLLLEDNPYGIFAADDAPRVPSLKALDRDRRVIYLGTFAKSALPGARVGYVVADQRVRDRTGHTTLFADELSKIKSMLTVNTSPITQAIIGGRLLEYDCSVRRANSRERAHYAANMRAVLAGLKQRFSAVDGVDWNTPSGGFFVVMSVPFTVDDALLEISARDYGVLWTPMCHFYEGDGGATALRLSCSVVGPEQIDEGLDRLAALVRDMAQRRRSGGDGLIPTSPG